jgi:polyhydroxyalkanoate synthase subunit PhaC
MPNLAPTLKDQVYGEGTARLYRFRRPSDRPASGALPMLIVPSLINRWYILDLREGATLAGALNRAFDTFVFDWGVPEDEDRYLNWDRVLAKLARAVRKVKAVTGAPKVGLLGYCMGGTLSGIHTALEPESIAALINLAGPFDFEKAGMLRTMVDPRWFDAGAIADAGNVSPDQMQSGFTALRPTLSMSKWIGLASVMHDAAQKEAFEALDHWASDNTPFPGAAYKTYIQELYQKNALIKGEHHVAGRRVDLSRIECPVLSIVASKDTICPADAAIGLNAGVRSKDKEVLTVKGGHVGAVVGDTAKDTLYPAIVRWLYHRLGAQPVAMPMAQA